MAGFKILLMSVYSPEMDEQLEEIGLCSIAAYLREKGFEVNIICETEDKIDYEGICAYAPDIVGITVYEVSKQQVYRVCNKLHSVIPAASICLGGCLPTYYYREIMEENDNVQFVIRGEGEHVWFCLASALSRGEGFENIKGLTYRKNDRVISTADQEYITDLNELPFPSRDILINKKLKIALISTSRGCRRKCSFCISDSFWAGWRGRDPQNVADEIEYIVRDLKVNCFDFIDSSFEDPGPGCHRAVEIAEEILRRDLRISYYANFRAEFHRIADDNVMRLLRRSGLCGTFIGIEAGNEQDLKIYHKSARVEDNCKIIELFRKYGIAINVGFINFNPYSSLKTLRENIDYLEKYGIASNLESIKSTYRLYRATHLERKLKEDNLLKEGHYDDAYRYEYLNPEVKVLQAYTTNYLDRLNEENDGLCKKLNYFNYFYLAHISHYRKCFEDSNNVGALLYLDEHAVKINNILGDLCSMGSQWFRSLICLMENNWSNELADRITGEMLSRDFAFDVLKRLNLEKAGFAKKLIKLDPKLQFII